MFFIILHFNLCYFVKKSPLHKAQQLVGFRQYKEAKELLNQMINESKNDNIELLVLRAKCNLNLNFVDQCIIDIKEILRLNCTDLERKEALITLTQLYIKTGELKNAEKYANQVNSSSLIQNVKELQFMNQQFELLYRQGQLKEASVILDKILEYSSLSDYFILNRTEIAWMQQDYSNYSKYASNFEVKYPKDSKIFFRNGIIMMCNGYLVNSTDKFEQSLLMLNPPSNSSTALKLAGKIINLLNTIDNAYESNNTKLLLNSIIELNCSSLKFCSKDDRLTQQVYLNEVRLMRLNLQIDKALEYLNILISRYPFSREFQFEKADIDLSLHNYDAAIDTYNNIQKYYYTDQISIEKARQKIEYANLLKRKSFYIDYYAFLGLNRDKCLQYTIQDIKDAYRKVVRHWHPDRFSDPDKKKEAEKIMKHVNSAYDILTNSKLKDFYDKGVDPYNPGSEKPAQFSDKLEEFFANANLNDEKREGPIRIQIEI